MSETMPLADALGLLNSTDPAPAAVPRIEAAVDSVARAVTLGQVDAVDLWAVGALHPSPTARLAVVLEAARRPADDEATELLAWAANDPDDRVAVAALTAIRSGGHLTAMDEVFVAAGRSAAAFDGVSSGPLDTRGGTAVSVLAELIDAHGTPAAERERIVLGSGSRRPSRRDLVFDTSGMVEVEAGTGPASRAFYIDANPVTWREYRDFLDAVREHGPVWSHPGEEANHDHDVLRHLPPHELEALMDHPVTQVSWFDAWAYATWRGKRLPSAGQWERAAGVLAGRRFPWGDEQPTEDRTRCRQPGSGDLAHAYSQGSLTGLTSAIGGRPTGETADGVADLLGNVWEWTRTRYLDGDDLTPFVGSSSYPDTIGDWTLSACVKGGSWATPAAELSARSRVAKHVLQHGPETGFRCVIEPDGE
ncbi:SUMF1/EgtB/PvdO family nonheme iron enzyme [Kitasatospora sp. NPDC101183]|uniref:SUMF1/EgtB/PvdO family nonheme iron enzyme n=1 Tax=Kitasatospora sp. NPDC101183 TaxID=3364100 RepID=UPI0038289CCD